jgi:hypothetical protein
MMILMVHYFIQIKEFKMCLQTKDGHFFTKGIIYKDLMKAEKINNIFYVVL